VNAARAPIRYVVRSGASFDLLVILDRYIPSISKAIRAPFTRQDSIAGDDVLVVMRPDGHVIILIGKFESDSTRLIVHKAQYCDKAGRSTLCALKLDYRSSEFKLLAWRRFLEVPCRFSDNRHGISG